MNFLYSIQLNLKKTETTINLQHINSIYKLSLKSTKDKMIFIVNVRTIVGPKSMRQWLLNLADDIRSIGTRFGEIIGLLLKNSISYFKFIKLTTKGNLFLLRNRTRVYETLSFEPCRWRKVNKQFLVKLSVCQRIYQ